MSKASMKSVYPVTQNTSPVREAILAVIVDNEPGVLSRVVGLISARGYNIESLTVAETDVEKQTSRVTIVTTGTEQKIEQIKLQLGRLVPVQSVTDISIEADGLERELALIRVIASGAERIEALRTAEIFRGHILDITNSSFIVEVTGARDKINAFIDLMQPLGLQEVSRTGVLSIKRGVNQSAEEK